MSAWILPYLDQRKGGTTMHDRHGRPLAVGDKVLVQCTVAKLWAGEPEYCNITLTTDVPMAGSPYTFVLNAGQVTKDEVIVRGPPIPVDKSTLSGDTEDFYR